MKRNFPKKRIRICYPEKSLNMRTLLKTRTSKHGWNKFGRHRFRKKRMSELRLFLPFLTSSMLLNCNALKCARGVGELVNTIEHIILMTRRCCLHAQAAPLGFRQGQLSPAQARQVHAHSQVYTDTVTFSMMQCSWMQPM